MRQREPWNLPCPPECTVDLVGVPDDLAIIRVDHERK